MSTGTPCADDGNPCTDDYCWGTACTHTAMCDGTVVCCEGECCLSGEICCGGECCVPERCCEDVCCGTDATAAAGNECILQVELKEIDFRAGHIMYEEADLGGWGAGAALLGIDWAAENNPDHPLAYMRGANMYLVVKVEVTAQESESLTLQMEGPGGLFGSTTLSVGCGTVTHTVSISTNDLPTYVALYEPLNLNWFIERSSTGSMEFIGATLHSLYVTYGTPHGEPTEKRLSEVCYWAYGSYDVDQAAVGIWDDLTHYEPPEFDLLQGGCPDPCPWSLMIPGNMGQCIHLAILMEHACEIIGVPASIGYVYATTDTNNFSTSAYAEEHREYEYAPGQTRDEYLHYYTPLDPPEHEGGFNHWEAVCVVDNHYYAVKEAHGSDTVALIKEIICPNDLGDIYQCWRYETPGGWVCNTDGQYPAPLPGACP